VGRRPGNELVIVHPSVSDHHCELHTAWGPEVTVLDTGSKNGTFVDGARVSGQMLVRAGQSLRFGAVEARLEIRPEEWNDDTSSASNWSAIDSLKAIQARQAALKAHAPDIIAPLSGAHEVDSTLVMAPPPRPAMVQLSASPGHAIARQRRYSGWIAWLLAAAAVAVATWFLFFRG
jgi:pSer/pThr/pTyr-binding forkhead associated (FHA) protein